VQIPIAMHRKNGLVKIYIWKGIWYNKAMEIRVDKSLHIGVAVSGGADSMVLLDLLLATGAKISAINVDHSIRGETSARDSAFVRAYCESRKVPFFYKKVDSLAYAGEKGMSTELAARELRYAFFDTLLTENKVDVVALAHHLDDQAETVLMRFLRGAGIRGLRGIADRTGYIHPLLAYSKEEILSYAQARGIPYVQDESNCDTSYRRNFLRHEVLPLLKTRYPDLNKVMGRTAAIFEEWEDYLLTQITPCQKTCWGVRLPLSVLNRHPAVAKKSIAEAIRTLGIQKDVEYTHLESILGLKDGTPHTRIHLPFGVEVVKEYTELVFAYRFIKTSYEKPYSREAVYEYGGAQYTFRKGEKIMKGATFDEDKLPAGAVVRTRREGDVFRRYKGREKSLSDYLTDEKIPFTQRERLLVLAKDKTVFAVLGVEIGDAVKIDQNTKNRIQIITYEGVAHA